MIPGIVAGRAIVPPPGSTFDPSLKGANIVLSDGDRTATKAGSGYQSVYGTLGHGAGHYAFAVEVVALPTASSILIGIADKTNAAAMIATFVGNNSGPVEAYSFNDNNGSGAGRYYRRMTVGNVSAGASTVYTVGDIITIAVNQGSNQILGYKNGSVMTAAFSGVTSAKTYFPAVSLQNGAQVRIITDSLPFTPAGASPWG